MNKIKKTNKKIKRKLQSLMVLMSIFILHAMPVYAGTDPKLATGTKSLIADATKILTGLVAGATVLFALINGFKWQAAADEEKPKHQKAVKNTLVIGTILTCISGLVTWIFSYYA